MNNMFINTGYKNILPFVRLGVLILPILLLLYSCQEKRSETDRKIDELMSKMTLDEKIGQMTQICFSTITHDGTKSLKLHPDSFRSAVINHHVGSFLSGTGSAREWIVFINEMQKIAVEESRLGIPLLIGIDHIHGANYVNEGTFLPHNLTLSCSFDTLLVSKCAEITAIETIGLGINWNFSPVLDLGKNPYWPRLYETYGEDPLVCGKLGSAYIKTMQKINIKNYSRLAACGKHFIGYSDPKSGWDRTPAEIPGQILYEQHIVPFEMGIDAGVESIMINSGEVNGIPVHTSKQLLTHVLQKQLGFEGIIITDIKDIMKVVEMHSGAKNEKEATLMAIEAGVDVSMACNSYDFIRYVRELIKEGNITEERIDHSVKKVLKLKYKLGLFEQTYMKEHYDTVYRKQTHLQIAQKAAGESIVLLKNTGILPLKDFNGTILLTGFASNSKRLLNGSWTLEWQGAEERRQPRDMYTLKTALAEEFPGSQIIHFINDTITTDKKRQFRAMARQCDVIVVTAGEELYSEFKGNIPNLKLDKTQQDWLKMTINADKPVVLILIEGRPRIITGLEKDMKAIIFAGYPGVMGANAIAGILSGRINPSGKLSFTYPRHVHHNVPYYHKISEEYIPLYPFGHGLSYSTFKYNHLQMNDTLIKHKREKIDVSVEVSNTGSIEGKETVLWYISDLTGRITRPVKKLAHFEKKHIKPGEKVLFNFTIIPEQHLTYPNRHGNKILENGKFVLRVGPYEKCFVMDLEDTSTY